MGRGLGTPARDHRRANETVVSNRFHFCLNGGRFVEEVDALLIEPDGSAAAVARRRSW